MTGDASIAAAGSDPGPAPEPKGGEPEPNPTPDPKPEPDPTKAPRGEGDPIKVARPEFVPEKFWDEDNSAIRTEDVFKSYGELETKLQEKAEHEGVPEDVAGYNYTLSEENTKAGIELADDDPMLTQYKDYALEKGIPANQFSDNVDFFIEFMQENSKEQLLTELTKLGKTDADVKTRVGQLNKWARANLSEEGYEKYVKTLTTAEAVEAFEELRAKFSTQRKLPGDGNSSISGDLTEADLHAMMKDERYWHHSKKDPKFVKEVTEGFQRLYSG